MAMTEETDGRKHPCRRHALRQLHFTEILPEEILP